MLNWNEQYNKERILSFDTTQWSIKKKEKVEDPREQRAVIYCRVSSPSQEKEWNWLSSQERKCSERCQNQNPPLTIDKIFIEPWVSWAKTERKELRRLINYLKEQNKKYKKISHFVVSEASRISRPDDIAEAFAIEAEIQSHWVNIVRLDAPNIDDSTDEWHLFKTIQYAVAWYERKKIARRASDWRRNRLLDGFRPFPQVPVGYIRNRISKKEYFDAIDEIKWPILKKWLEAYASGAILTDADLWRYWNEQWLLSNAKWATKLQRTFVEKVMQLHRILFYAWYIIYPERWVTEPIEWQHEWLISLSTAHKIIQKQQAKHKNTNKLQWVTKRMSDEHPMRWVITCQWCKRKFTSRNTSKMVWPKWDKKKKLYPFYWCNNKDCDQRINVNKEKLEEDFSSFLEQMKLPAGILRLIEKIFEQTREEAKKDEQKIKRKKRNNIKAMQKRQWEIEEVLPKTQNVKLYQKMEEERVTLDEKIIAIEESLEQEAFSNDRMKALLQKVQHLFEDPLAIRELGNQTMRWLLITVRFGDSLFYTKNEWLKTIESGTLYSVYRDLQHLFPQDRRPGIRTRDLGLKRPLL